MIRVILVLITYFLVKSDNQGLQPNIVVILADDLGFGDLSVHPFTGSGIYTPELEKMALSGSILNNFHSAAPVCTPARASILTGLYPWRMNIKSIYGTGIQANDHLHVTNNIPILLSANGYHTAHVGKWHLGGLTPKDIMMRKNNPYDCNTTKPGPNQHGYLEYVSMMEGPESPRLKYLLPTKSLYSKGSKYLLKNDNPYPVPNDVLTNVQTNEAIRIMKECVHSKKRFYIHLAYDAPHSPWEVIPGNWTRQYKSLWYSDLKSNKENRAFKYATMVIINKFYP